MRKFSKYIDRLECSGLKTLRAMVSTAVSTLLLVCDAAYFVEKRAVEVDAAGVVSVAVYSTGKVGIRGRQEAGQTPRGSFSAVSTPNSAN